MITVLRTWGLALAQAVAVAAGWVHLFRTRTPRVQDVAVDVHRVHQMGEG